mgnify:CR=1 FL=1
MIMYISAHIINFTFIQNVKIKIITSYLHPSKMQKKIIKTCYFFLKKKKKKIRVAGGAGSTRTRSFGNFLTRTRPPTYIETAQSTAGRVGSGGLCGRVGLLPSPTSYDPYSY